MNFKNIIFFTLFTNFSAYSTELKGQKPIVTLFSHGIADTKKQAYIYAKSYEKHGIKHINERYLFYTPYVSFNYPDATNKFYRVNWNETSFGQENEIARLHEGYDFAMEQYEETCDIILYGLSRGASNQVIFAGRYNCYDNIKALLLESPYNTMTEIIERMMVKKGFGWLPVSYGETVAELIFGKYKRNGWSPKNYAGNISKDVPILIICSKEDQTVPYESSINLYKQLVASGHKHTYILVVEHGQHARILQGPDGETYQQVVNAFYKKYNLPHCPMSAEKGEPLLALCQPHV